MRVSRSISVSALRMFHAEHTFEEFVENEEQPVRGDLVHQPGHAPPEERRWTALVEYGPGAIRDRPAVIRPPDPASPPTRRLQPRLDDVERVRQVAPYAARGRARRHVAQPPIIVGFVLRVVPSHDPIFPDVLVREESEYRVGNVAHHLYRHAPQGEEGTHPPLPPHGRHRHDGRRVLTGLERLLDDLVRHSREGSDGVPCIYIYIGFMRAGCVGCYNIFAYTRPLR